MNRKKILSVMLSAAVAMTMTAGCSKEDDGAVKLSEKYLDSVIDADFESMADMLKDDDDLSDYEIDDRSLAGLTAVLGLCEYEQTDYDGGKDEVTIEYTLSLPDVGDIGDNDYESYADLIDSLEDLDETECTLEVTLVSKGDKWLVKDADSTLGLYEDILDGLSEAQFDYTLGYEGVLASLEEHFPTVAEEFASHGAHLNNYNIIIDGVQFAFDRFDSTDAAFELYTVVVECQSGDTPTEDEHYRLLNINGRTAGVVWKDDLVIQIYDEDGTHSDEVNAFIEDLQEML